MLIIRLGLCDPDTNDADSSPALRLFRADLEVHLTAADSVTDRASRLGYSPRTISRASLQATGRTAKQLADERIALEARRLLTQPGTTATRVARELGFSEPTNFAKFFRRLTGERPTDWLRSVHPPDQTATSGSLHAG